MKNDKFMLMRVAASILVLSTPFTLILTGTKEETELTNDVKVVAVMFTTTCENCGARTESDYSIVSEQGQIWCRECDYTEDLNKDSDIVEQYFGEDKYER